MATTVKALASYIIAERMISPLKSFIANSRQEPVDASQLQAERAKAGKTTRRTGATTLDRFVARKLAVWHSTFD